MKSSTIAFLATALTLATSSAVLAVTYLVPTDRQLVLRSEAVVIARAIHSAPALNEYGAIVTTTELTVEVVLKGKLEALSSLRLNEPGGRIGEKSTAIPGSPRFADGQRYLLFVASQGKSLTTWGLGLGKFDFTSDRMGRPIIVRGADDGEGVFGFDESHPAAMHVEQARLEEPFLGFIRDTARGQEPGQIGYFVAQPAVAAKPRTSSNSAPRLRTQANAVRRDYLADGIYRWQDASQTIVVCCNASGAQPGFDGPAAVQAAVANWNNGGGSVHYTYGGEDPTANHGLSGTGSGAPDGKNAVLFNDPHDDLVGGILLDGVIGIGGISAGSPPYTLPDGDSFNDIREVDVVIGKSAAFLTASQATFVGIVTHELGHTLGFRHSDQTSSNDPNNPCADPLPCAAPGQAIMASTVTPELATLQPYDRQAVSVVYGNGLVCTAPTITTQPQGITIIEGSFGLSVVATGTSLTYQWFTGAAANTSSGVIGTDASINVSPTVTTSYWVRVTSGCGADPTADSSTATITVTPPQACSPAAITEQPVSGAIAQGQSTSISVTATGTNLTYQWFSGNAGSIASGVIGTDPSMIVSPAVTTSYWVRVTSGCGTDPTVDSTAARITVTPVTVCSPAAITAQPLAGTIAQGQSTTLSVTASGTSLTYQWFRGTAGSTSSGVIGTGSSITVSPAVTTSFWVRVTGGCGTNPAVDSKAATVTVTVSGGGACTPPSFLFGPADQLILTGAATALSVGVQGTSPAITWYRGFKPDTSIPVGTGATFATPPLLFPTTYWVRAKNSCGQADSANATVTVGACIRPLITSATASPSSVTAAANAATLSVAAIGTSLTYQWFVGLSGNTQTPLPNGTAATVVVKPATTANYWVRVSSGCAADVVKSTTITVSVGSCAGPEITTQPADAPLDNNATTKLTVVVSGTAPLRYQWFRGTTTADRSNPVGGNAAAYTVPAITGSTSYFAVVTNACGTVTSRVATVSPARRHGARH